MSATRLAVSLAVLGSMVAVVPSVVSDAVPPAAASTAAVTSDVRSVPLKSAKPAGDAREVATAKTFSLVAVRWTGPRPASIEVQIRTGGRWGAWTALEPVDSGEDRASAPKATEPLWAGASTAVRVRSDVDERTLDVVLIDPGRGPNDSRLVRTHAVGRPPVISRAGWGADEALRCMDAEYMPTTKAATIHHTAGTNNYGPGDSAAIVRGVYVYHARTLGWCDIGYNALVDKYGQIFEGAFGGLDRAIHGAHAGGFNDFTFGVSMMGLYTGVNPSDVQLEAVSQLVAWKLGGSYRNPRANVTLISTGGGTSKYPAGTPVNLPVIFGHRDVGNTECPGTNGYAQLPRIRDRVGALVGDWTATDLYRKWQGLGGEAGPAGAPHRVEQPAARGGRSVWFDGGRWGLTLVYWTPATGAHEVHGAIVQRWAAMNWENGLLGFPTTDETATPDGVGRYNHFEGGSIYWSPRTGASDVHGPIRQRWSDLGWERSYLGYPLRTAYAVPGGLRQDFQYGYILRDAATGRVTDHRSDTGWGRLPRR